MTTIKDQVQSILEEVLNKYADESLSKDQLLDLILQSGYLEHSLQDVANRTKNGFYFYSIKKALIKYLEKEDLTNVLSFQSDKLLIYHTNKKSRWGIVRVFFEAKGFQVVLAANKKKPFFFKKGELPIEKYATNNPDPKQYEHEDWDHNTIYFKDLKEVVNFLENELPTPHSNEKNLKTF